MWSDRCFRVGTGYDLFFCYYLFSSVFSEVRSYTCTLQTVFGSADIIVRTICSARTIQLLPYSRKTLSKYKSVRNLSTGIIPLYADLVDLLVFDLVPRSPAVPCEHHGVQIARRTLQLGEGNHVATANLLAYTGVAQEYVV